MQLDARADVSLLCDLIRKVDVEQVENSFNSSDGKRHWKMTEPDSSAIGHCFGQKGPLLQAPLRLFDWSSEGVPHGGAALEHRQIGLLQ